EGKLSVDKNYIREHIKLFEENSESIKERLSYIGIKI
ncbi:nucleotidyltransferase, partial [Sulfolobus sp. B5]